MVSRKFTRKEIVLITSITLFILGILTFYIWHQAESIRLGYEVQELEEKAHVEWRANGGPGLYDYKDILRRLRDHWVDTGEES